MSKSGKTVGKSNLSVEELDKLLYEEKLKTRKTKDNLVLVRKQLVKFLNNEIAKL